MPSRPYLGATEAVPSQLVESFIGKTSPQSLEASPTITAVVTLGSVTNYCKAWKLHLLLLLVSGQKMKISANFFLFLNKTL